MDDYSSYLQRKYPALSALSHSDLSTISTVIRSESHPLAESARSPVLSNSIVPFDFLGLDNSGDGFMSAYFNWRWFTRPSDGVQYRLLTVEFGDSRQILSYGPPRVTPRDLRGKEEDYYEELFNCVFNWRNFKRGEETFKVVTLETIANVDGLNYPIIGSLRPLNLKGLPTDQQVWDNLNFYWRWFTRDDTQFRVLTIE